MANKENRVSINKFEAATNDGLELFATEEWRGLTINVQKVLNFKQMLTFVRYVVESCFTEDAEYLPEVKDFLTRCAIIDNYTNIALPSNAEKKYELVYNSDIIPFIIQYVDRNQFEALLDSIDRKIEYKAQSNIDGVVNKVNEVISALEMLEKNVTNIFNGVDGDTIESIANAIAGGSFDMDKLTDNIVKKKYNTDDAETPLE